MCCECVYLCPLIWLAVIGCALWIISLGSRTESVYGLGAREANLEIIHKHNRSMYLYISVSQLNLCLNMCTESCHANRLELRVNCHAICLHYSTKNVASYSSIQTCVHFHLNQITHKTPVLGLFTNLNCISLHHCGVKAGLRLWR